MNDYKELIELLAHPTDGRDSADIMIAAADAIEQLVKERDELYMEVMDCTKKIGCKAIEQVKKERDAAVKDLQEWCDELCYCEVCKHNGKCSKEFCKFANNWEWRGVQE